MALAAYYTYTLVWSDNKTSFLIGDTSHGHYQIELACSACHGEAFSGREVLQQACVNCHGAELQLADDSHPKSKFTDPRNADRVAILDARYCITCHTEHKPESTLAMGLTIAADYCYYCHQETLEERPSHTDLAFDTCATAGCHNYHDNRALYEDYLVQHANEPLLLANPHQPSLNATIDVDLTLALGDIDAPSQFQDAEAISQWLNSKHAVAGVNCRDCHTVQPETAWVEKPGITSCNQCHEFHVDSYTSGKHGMRLANTLPLKLSAMTPRLAQPNNKYRQRFNPDSFDYTQHCNTCHGAHDFNTTTAAVDGCLTCHNDEHSQSFLASPHGRDWLESADSQVGHLNSDLPGATKVSCATCHMPRIDLKGDGQFHVQHNQNANLRPNEKMIRDVCSHCHGLGFAIDSLADDALIRNNFNGKPARHIPSIDWALERER